jgi:hypothetical protein
LLNGFGQLDFGEKRATAKSRSAFDRGLKFPKIVGPVMMEKTGDERKAKSKIFVAGCLQKGSSWLKNVFFSVSKRR